MRCDNCEYCKFYSLDNMWICDLGFPDEWDSKDRCGCKYTKKQLEKIYQEQMKEQEREHQAFCEWCEKEEINDKDIY